MLQSISVSNYALIRQLDIDFNPGLSIITGETGAGKSILLGALSLILGNRAESSVLLVKSKKCVVEGIFRIEEYGLEPFFQANDLDYGSPCILRREIAPGGKSRAFINDTPVTLPLLKEIGQSLVDIHSQHQSLLLGDTLFQLKVIDELTRQPKLLADYQSTFHSLRKAQQDLKRIIEQADKSKVDLDYYQFQFEQLETAKLFNEEEQYELESEQEILTHAEEIKLAIDKSMACLDGEELTVLPILKNAIRELAQVEGFFPLASNLKSRIESTTIELKDIASELEIHNEKIEHDPARLTQVQDRLNTIYSLQQKHKLRSIKELIDLRDQLSDKINEIESYDDEIRKHEQLYKGIAKRVGDLALQLSSARIKNLPQFETKVNQMLKNLGMPNSLFKVENRISEEFAEHGIDNFSFLFTANKKSEPQEIQKVASGGEISRLMLCIKSMLSESSGLPTIIFDEIDTGVSGDIADKVGNIIKEMSKGMQVINITHLPQIAAKGDYHYLVYKDEMAETTETGIRLLSGETRLEEIAKMLSGKDVSHAAMENARVLLSQ
ncbi:MAG: DNA repair protein RecN [Bacteroidales bacterium]|nr:DNA repair protein RecN [Bacteroidales bacterium]MCF8456801.1 DNA repair protein RecN [Bacteroidales bacterium]